MISIMEHGDHDSGRVAAGNCRERQKQVADLAGDRDREDVGDRLVEWARHTQQGDIVKND